MPCRTDYPDDEDIRQRREASLTKAALCALLTAVENAGYDPLGKDSAIIIDWTEAGVTRKELASWWKQHKADDERRRAKEAEAARLKAVRKAALDKLTPEERSVLGVKS